MDKLRLIQCGVGGFGDHWVRRVCSRSPDFDLVALVDPVGETLRAAGEAVGLGPERLFPTLEAALDAAPADAVLTVTPPAVHLEHARLAFGRGLHLLTEKPIADALTGAREMVALAKHTGRQLAVSQNYRYSPAVQTLRRLVFEEAVGPLGHGHLDFYIPVDFPGGFRETMDYPLLLDMAIHHLDLVRFVTGRDIERVLAWSFRPAWSWFRHDPGLKMLLELEGGLPFSYSGDWTARGRATTWNGEWRLQGSEGSLHLKDDQVLVGRSERWNKNPSLEEIEPDPFPRQHQAATLHEFAVAIRTGRPAPTSGEDNLKSFGAVMAGVASAREGRAVGVRALLEG